MKKKIRLTGEGTKQRFSLTVFFAVIVFAVLLVAIALAALTVYILTLTGVIGSYNDGEIGIGSIFLYVFAASLIIGAGMSFLLAKFPLRPVNDLIDHMNRLAGGDYKTRLSFAPSVANHKAFKEVSESVNKLAEELESTELLRNDFVNNFSHEFKTPIVSIAGLAKLVNKGNLPEELQKQYLTAIEEESLRLARMSTNILNLTKIEKQNILTDLTRFNLSEQIRSSLLLFENKWTERELDLELDFDEHYINANEELLKEVWINLFDNAVKFTPRNGKILVSVSELTGTLTVKISNTSAQIPSESLDKLFNKFYQLDDSHAKEGSGVGLAMVKKIVQLHGGEASAAYADGLITFTVCLPQK